MQGPYLSLLDIKAYMQQRPAVTSRQMSHHFQQPVELIEGLLNVWVGRGDVRKLHCQSGCVSGACSHCPVAMTQVWYAWVKHEDLSA